MFLQTKVFLSPLLILLVIQTPATNKLTLNSNELNTNEIDTYIARKMRWPRIPGLALAIVKDDRVVYLKAYGEADPSGRPMTPQTPFIIGSLTKSFTALATMQLVEAGKVDLDVPVQKYIPWFRVADPTASAQITVRQLLYQTSGLPMIRGPQLAPAQDAGALEGTVRSLADAQLSYPPGQGFAYANANYDTLGVIVQMVSGHSYEDYVKEHIFAPLEMRNSFASQEEATKQGAAVGHRWWFGFPVAFTPAYNRSELPAGYLFSSAEDVAHFMIAELNGGRYGNTSILSSEGIALTQKEPAPKAYAMGWERPNVGGHHLINHDGGTGTFQCSVFLDPDERVGVFVAANVMVALDAFSAPHGNEPLDGITTRGMAQTVLGLATDRPLPDQGRGIRRLYILFDLVILALTVLLLISLLRMRRRYQRWRETGITNRWSFGWRGAVTAVAHFALPSFVVYLAVNDSLLQTLAMFQPDLFYWLVTVAAVLFVKGVVEITLVGHTFRKTY